MLRLQQAKGQTFCQTTSSYHVTRLSQSSAKKFSPSFTCRISVLFASFASTALVVNPSNVPLRQVMRSLQGCDTCVHCYTPLVL